MNKITIDNELIESIKFYIKLSDSYLNKNLDIKKDKSKLLFYNQVLKSRLVLIEFLREIMYLIKVLLL